MDALHVGDTLPNGATVLDYRPGGDGFGVVLAMLPAPHSVMPFATWTVDEAGPSTFGGKYRRTIGAAWADHCERAGLTRPAVRV